MNSSLSESGQNEVSVKNRNRMANNVDPDEMAHYEPSHQDLHCLQRGCGAGGYTWSIYFGHFR